MEVDDLKERLDRQRLLMQKEMDGLRAASAGSPGHKPRNPYEDSRGKRMESDKDEFRGREKPQRREL